MWLRPGGAFAEKEEDDDDDEREDESEWELSIGDFFWNLVTTTRPSLPWFDGTWI